MADPSQMAAAQHRIVPPIQTTGWMPVTGRNRGVAVVVRCEGGWAEGRLGRVVGYAGPPGWFTVQLDDGTKFLARPGQAVTRPRETA